MNTIRFLPALVCLLFFAVTGQTQEAEQTHGRDLSIYKQLSDYRNEHRLVDVDMLKSHVRLMLDEWLTLFILHGMYHDRELCSVLGIAEEQWYEVFGVDDHLSENLEWLEIQQTIDAMEQLLFESGGVHNADVETINKLLALEDKSIDMSRRASYCAIANVLPPDVTQKLKEGLLATMGKFPMPFPIPPCTFEALDLTDAQRQKVERIKKELTCELEKYLEYLGRWLVVEAKKLENEYVKLGIDLRGGIDSDLGDAIVKRLMEEDIEYKRFYCELLSREKAFTTLFKTKMFAVLTNEQKNRLQELIDNPPEHARIFRDVAESRVKIWEVYDEFVCKSGTKPKVQRWSRSRFAVFGRNSRENHFSFFSRRTADPRLFAQ